MYNLRPLTSQDLTNFYITYPCFGKDQLGYILWTGMHLVVDITSGFNFFKSSHLKSNPNGPEHTKFSFADFIHLVIQSHYCLECRSHGTTIFEAVMNDNKTNNVSRSNAQLLSIFHSAVNIKLKKPSLSISESEWVQFTPFQKSTRLIQFFILLLFLSREKYTKVLQIWSLFKKILIQTHLSAYRDLFKTADIFMSSFGDYYRLSGPLVSDKLSIRYKDLEKNYIKLGKAIMKHSRTVIWSDSADTQTLTEAFEILILGVLPRINAIKT